MIKLIHGRFEQIPSVNLGRVDLIMADPPDCIGMKYAEFIDRQPAQEYENNLRLWLGMMANLTKGPIFFTFNEKWTQAVENAIVSVGIPLIQRLQWYYTFGQDQTTRGKYALCYRPIYWLNSEYVRPDKIKVPSARQEKYNDKRAAKGGKMPPNVWEIPRVCGTFKEKRKWLPTQLPESLVERIVKGHCRPCGRVLDPFIGSGTTAIVCQRLGLDCVGIDIDKKTIQKTSEYLGVDYE
ncbi:MAG: hypothetical protein DRJ03_00725 [Chloroflexi bacterium]|nr:MAG: hypothetical protein DRJ03_00725 [Chloroflexota bacterium]